MAASARDVFLKASEIARGEERDRFLDQACGGDDALRQKVLALLAADERPLEFVQRLESPAFHSRPADDVPRTIGPYKLIRLLGEGGMGTVWVAEQQHPVKRTVALKLIKPGMDSQAVIGRFEAERQALAIMDHSGIAKVLDAGTTESGHPYFVMELVDGQPITEYCDVRRLNTEQRIRIFVEVCEAVQHAHQKGIIHRDIKPSNVLVGDEDGRPRPRVIDFGVAKAVGSGWAASSVFTETGQLVGTLEYMSPEQAGTPQADVDTRSDIYSLGVLLYELLTGTTPFERRQLRDKALEEMLRVIREEEPPRPSAKLSTSDSLPSLAANRAIEPARLTRTVRGDLDWVVMKSLEKDRERRYASANAMVEDLQRFLLDEPVSAGPPSAVYRLRKFLRRNRLSAALSGIALLGLLGGAIGTTAGMLQAQRQAKAKSQALDAERKARQDADVATDRAVQALQTLTDETIDRLIAAQPELSSSNREFLNQIVGQLEEFTRATNNSVKARVIQADSLNHIGNLKGSLGDHAGAIAAYRQAIAIWEPLCAERPDKPDYRRGMADAWSNLGIYLYFQREFDASEKAHLTAISIHEKLAKEFPSNISYQHNVANCRNSYGVMLKEVGRNAETMQQYELAIAELDQLLTTAPDDRNTLHRLASVENNYAMELHMAGKTDEALDAGEEVIRRRERLLALPDASPRDRYLLAAAMGNQGLFCLESGRIDEAITWLERADPVASQAVAELPALVEFREGAAGGVALLADACFKKKRYEASADAGERAAQLLSQLTRELPDRTDLWAQLGQTWATLARAREAMNETAKAITDLQSANAAFDSAARLSPDNLDILFAQAGQLVKLARLLQKSGDTNGARERTREANHILESLQSRAPSDERVQTLLESLRKNQD